VALNVKPRQLIGIRQLLMQFGLCSSTARFTSATSSSNVPYCGTSCWYIADIACEKFSRISSAVMVFAMMPYLQ
jgi:hypothetical protein